MWNIVHPQECLSKKCGTERSRLHSLQEKTPAVLEGVIQPVCSDQQMAIEVTMSEQLPLPTPFRWAGLPGGGLPSHNCRRLSSWLLTFSGERLTV